MNDEQFKALMIQLTNLGQTIQLAMLATDVSLPENVKAESVKGSNLCIERMQRRAGHDYFENSR